MSQLGAGSHIQGLAESNYVAEILESFVWADDVKSNIMWPYGVIHSHDYEQMSLGLKELDSNDTERSIQLSHQLKYPISWILTF